MSESVLIVLNDIEKFTEEMDVTGIHNDALLDAIEKFNRALEWAQQDDSENPVWRLLTPLRGEETSASTLALSCHALSDVIRSKLKQTQSTPTWLVTEDAELEGYYEGVVVICEGRQFTLNGSVKGKVVIQAHATFVCEGFLNGDVEKDPLGQLVSSGQIRGNITTMQLQDSELGSELDVDASE